tara:strand:+ start:207 stop:461 length:255 start_codon:yes stop_codon:yes gene_type:complete
MESIRVRCRSCGKEVESRSGKTISCGCSNMVTISGDVISAVDMAEVVMLNSKKSKKNSLFSREEMEWQEDRRRRKVRRLDFEVR